MIFASIRCVLAVVFLGVALLAVFRAPNISLFYVAVGATEYGHWFALVSLLIATSGGWRGGAHGIAAIAALLAAALFASPVIRAAQCARDLPQRFAQGFSPGHPVDSTPVLDWKRLWLGSRIPPVNEQRLTFAEHEGQKLTLDFYAAPASKRAPCIVVLHTGGWNNGTAAEFQPFNRDLAHRGFAVAAIEYRLAPRWPWPAQREDTLDAILYLQQHAEELGIDPEQFILMGRSAGGQIAEAVAYERPDPAIRACIAFYSPADMLFAFQYADEHDILNSYKLLTQYLGGTPEQQRRNYESASGILHVSPHTVPTLLIHGRRDELVWFKQSERLAAKLAENGTPYVLIGLPWATHAFDYNIDGPSGQISTWTVEHFLQSVLAPHSERFAEAH